MVDWRENLIRGIGNICNRTGRNTMDFHHNFEKQFSYMYAVLYICEMNSIDLEDVKKFISPIIKGKIEAEAMALNFLPKQNTLF